MNPKGEWRLVHDGKKVIMLRHCLGITQTKHEMFVADDEAACRKEADRLRLEQPAPRIAAPMKSELRARAELKRPERKQRDVRIVSDRWVMAHDGKRAISRQRTRLVYFTGTAAECDAEADRLKLVSGKESRLRPKPQQR